MKLSDTAAIDAEMMRRCLAISKASAELGEYPYGAVISRNGEVVCESTNRVRSDRDVTRHAEVVALSEAQRLLKTTSLDECTMYSIAEPCAYCSYAIRETRIGRVVYALRSPVMGGHSRWDILADNRLSSSIPEAFAMPPQIVPGFMQHEAEQVFKQWNRVIWKFIRLRGLFVSGPSDSDIRNPSGKPKRNGMQAGIMRLLRRTVFDRIGRR